MTETTTSNNNNNNKSNLRRSLQAGSKEASILLEILQGSSGQAFAKVNEGWDGTTPGETLLIVINRKGGGA